MQPDSKEDNHDSFHMERLRDGDHSSFKALFHQYESRLYQFCLHLTRSPSDAEEIVQEVFIKIWETRHRLNVELCFSAYMIRIAKNLIYNKASRRIREQAFQVYHVRTTDNYSDVTQEELNLLSTENILSQLIDKLPFMQKKVFTLSRFNGLSNQDIADRLQLSDSTIKNHIHLALKSLKEQLLKHHHLYFAFLLLEALI